MPTINSTLDQLHTALSLGRFTAVIFKAKRRRAADLSQLRQFSQNPQFALIKFALVLLGNFFLHMYNLGIIQLLLCILKFHVTDFFQFFRKILQHILFQTAKDKWRHHFLQPGHGRLIVVLYDRSFKFLFKGIITVEKSRH